MMKYAAGLAVLAGAASTLAQRPIVTSPPSLVTCLPASITASGGTGPYYITVLPGGQPTAAPLEDLGTTDGQLTWIVNLPAGTSVTIQVRDQRGDLNYSAQTTIQAGSSTSCVGQSASISGASSAASTPAIQSTASGAASALSSTATGTSTSVPASSTGGSSLPPSSTGPSASASSARPTGAASMVRPAAGALALVGAAAYLLL